MISDRNRHSVSELHGVGTRFLSVFLRPLQKGDMTLAYDLVLKRTLGQAVYEVRLVTLNHADAADLMKACPDITLEDSVHGC